MASRAIYRRKKLLLDHPNMPAFSIQHLSSFEKRGSSHEMDSQSSNWAIGRPPVDADGGKERHGSLITKGKLFGSLQIGLLTQNSCGRYIAAAGYRNARAEIIAPLGIRWMSQSLRYASTATARQPEMDEDDDNEEHNRNHLKEASPEECDQAVEGLSSVKSKAKAKQLRESQKAAKSVVQKFWAQLSGIGLALRAVAFMSREDWAKKLHHWKDEFVSALQHYWLGTKLLWADVRICSRLLLKLASGRSLSRRERQQLTRTTADIFRLVPFAVFIIVPFMEFLLPVFLKLFPNMLPSTFQDKMKEQEALKRRLNARIEYAKFLQDTVKEMAKEVQISRSGELKKTAEDLDEFLNKVRTGARVSNDEILGFAKLFNDELTLDNISRPRLVNMCKYMGISPFGTDAYLRYMLRKRLAWIKNDDRMIQAEGIESLLEAELRQACRDRGKLGLLSVEEMRQQLRDWLDLSLNHSVPIFTTDPLQVIRAFNVSGKMRPEEAVQATLSSLPDEVVDTVGITALPSEDSVSERRRKLEYLEMQEELIKIEEDKEEAKQARKKESEMDLEDLALKEMIIPTAKEAQDLARAKIMEKQEQLCNISRALAVLSSASSVSREREAFLSLVNKEIELYNSMAEKEGTEGEEEAKKAYRAAREESCQEAGSSVGNRVSSALIDRVDAMLQKLEKEIDDVDEKIGDRWRLLDRDYDGKVTPEEVASAAMYLKDTIGKEGVQELISNLSKDGEGKILVEDIVKLGARTDDVEAAGARG